MSDNDVQAGAWPATSRDGQARAQALGSETLTATPTQVIDYDSRGRLLIIDQDDRAAVVAARLAEGISAWIVAAPAGAADGEADPRKLHARVTGITGHLGDYTVTVAGADDEDIDLAKALRVAGERFDLVLDLASPAQLDHEVPPVGYYAPCSPADLETALDELNDLTGEFEKPKYFRYDASICAHDRSGQRGCSRCIDACPTRAITPAAESIEVDPYLCQGGGSCTAACPSGAITYAYPKVDELLDYLRRLLNAYAQAQGQDPCVLFYDGERGLALVDEARVQLPEHVLAIEVEEIGSIGMDCWLAALAFGAAQVVLLVPPATPASVATELDRQAGYCHAMLEGLGLPEQHLRITRAATATALAEALTKDRSASVCHQGFATFDEKRNTIFTALARLAARNDEVPPPRALPQGAPFGEVLVDQSNCTLCFACASICPVGALVTGTDTPQLRFIESKCVQCGLCENTCPESAVRRAPRIRYDVDAARETRILYEEEPFLCVGCGKPFATQRIIDTMLAKLEGHRMFSDPAALRRLKLCEDCRVKDMFGPGGDASGSN